MNKLFEISKVFKFGSNAIVDGNIPLKLFPLIFINVKLDKLPIVDGIEPEKQLVDNIKDLKFVKFIIADVKTPLIG